MLSVSIKPVNSRNEAIERIKTGDNFSFSLGPQYPMYVRSKVCHKIIGHSLIFRRYPCLKKDILSDICLKNWFYCDERGVY